MRSLKINQDWDFGLGQVDLGNRLRGIWGDRKVNLPHDYMIESEVYADAPSGAASGPSRASGGIPASSSSRIRRRSFTEGRV